MTTGDIAKLQEEGKDGKLIDDRISSGNLAAGGERRNSAKLNADSPSHAKFDPAMKKTMLALEKERQGKAKRDAQDETKREMEAFRAKGKSSAANIIWPTYKRDDVLECDREVDKPPETLYIALGWDEDKTTERKHYRRFFNDELENVKSVLAISSPF